MVREELWNFRRKEGRLMVEKVEAYRCSRCKKVFPTKQEAITCEQEDAIKDELYEQFLDLETNPDFEEVEHNAPELFDITDVEYSFEPREAKTLAEITEVTRTMYGRGSHIAIFVRK
jgi:hypothetical protein